MPDTVTIRAEMISDIPQKAAESTGAMRGLADGVKQMAGTADAAPALKQVSTEIDGIAARSTAAAPALTQAGQGVDSLAAKASTAASGGTSTFHRALDGLNDSGKKVGEGLANVGDLLTEKLIYPMRQLTYAIEGGTVAMVTWGLTTEATFQKVTLALSTFTNSSAVGATAFTALEKLSGPVPLSALASAYESLSQAGLPQSKLLSTLRGLTGLASTSLAPATNLPSMTSALSSIVATGLIQTSDVQAFSGAGVNIWGILAKETGTTEQELRTRFLRAGTPLAMPANFLQDLLSQPAATGGLAAYRRTLPGEFEELKKSISEALAGIETPLGGVLAGVSGKIEGWAGRTEDRFKRLGGSLGADWSSNNMTGFSKTLATIFGDPKLERGIDAAASSLHGLIGILQHDVIPEMKTLGTVAIPILQATGNVLDYIGQISGKASGPLEGLVGILTKDLIPAAKEIGGVVNPALHDLGSIFGFLGLGGGHPAAGRLASTSAAAGTVIHGDVNITVPGSGNPTRVANAIPKALNAQIKAQQQMASRRGAQP